jgi:hypothetical protein
MKKFIYISSLLLFMSISVNAQLTMNWNKKFFIGPETGAFVPLLMVNNDWFFIEGEDTCSIGTGSAPHALNGKNIGVFGGFWLNPNYSQDSNFGVLGIVESNANHGRNYGLCGMIDPSTSSGGAGIYAVDCDYCYTFPHSLGGAYAGYFVGNVHVSDSLIVHSQYTIADRRLCDNIVSLSQSKRSGTTTLENLLNMNIVEYNLKERQFEEVSGDVAPEKAEKLKRELEFLKKEEQEKTSRRHFGVDAHDLQNVYPDLVLEGQDGYLSVNYLEMVPLVIRSIQELKQEIDELSE